ncbi:MAG: hypothetical protein LBH19_14015 [Dysgonamonadaceae bacterium]|jgi:hypothetical protein|nr:hypothetical protein [Dysgonamonadaceae bacterium]
MKTRHYIIAVIFTVFVIVTWFLFHCWADDYFINQTDGNELNNAYVAAGALFTAIAFLGTIFVFFYQYKTELRKTSLTVFTTVYSGMQNDPRLNEAFKYILKNIDRTTETVTHTKTICELKKEDIYIPRKRDKKEVAKRFWSLIYFCDRMEYLGTLIKNDYIDISLLYSRGRDIVCAYKVLEQWSFFENGFDKKYIHFRYLVYFINKKQKKYEEYCKKLENMLVTTKRNSKFIEKLNRARKISFLKSLF